MEVFRASEPAPSRLRGGRAALGNLDGVHRGHQAVLAAAAAAPGAGPWAAVVFDPHPRELFTPDAPPFRLQSDAQRARRLAALGVQALFVLPFDRALAGLTDDAFVRAVLCERLGLAHVAIGEDFRFGRARMGDAARLATLGAMHALGVAVVGPVGLAGAARISSSDIRTAIVEGRPEAAAALLGAPFAIEGRVSSGDQRGRLLGFPTANVPLGPYVRPKFGVYAVWVDVGDGVARPGVANVGVKPTIAAQGGDPLLEAHLFDFSGDLYGQTIEVSLAAFLRAERRFDGLAALTAQIEADTAAARAALGGGSPA